jgi:hypothetical protein
MALRPLAFSIRLRDKDRTLRIHNDPDASGGYILEDSRPGEEKRIRSHASVPDAVRDAAATWRKRLN